MTKAFRPAVFFAVALLAATTATEGRELWKSVDGTKVVLVKDIEPGLDGSNPTNLTRVGGWSATALRPGDRVRVEINPLREGDQKSARLTKVTLVDTGLELGTAYIDADLVRPK